MSDSLTSSINDSQARYQKNLDFWETAWSRVKQASTKIPDSLEYIKTIPGIFQQYKCKNILDIACGSGWLSFYLNEHGFSVTGVDIAPSAIRLANEVLEDRSGLENISFKEMDMFAMDFPENHFDGILINAAFEHLDYQRGDAFLSAIKKFLAPDAVMFAVFDKVASGSKGEFEVLEDGTHQYSDEFRAGMFLRNYPDEELFALLKKHQWQIEKLDYNSYGSRLVTALNKK